MTLNQIEILLFFYVNNRDAHPRANAPAVREDIALLVREDILQPVVQGVHPLPAPPATGPHKATARGEVLIGMLCAVPFPVKGWIDPRDGKAVKGVHL